MKEIALKEVVRVLNVVGVDIKEVVDEINTYVEASRAANELAKPGESLGACKRHWQRLAYVHYLETETKLTQLETFGLLVKQFEEWPEESPGRMPRLDIRVIRNQLAEMLEISGSPALSKFIGLIDQSVLE